MSLLSEYLSVLNPTEKKHVRTIPVSVREREVLAIMVEYDADKHEEQRILRGISRGNWDKLQSVLLRKCYDAIVPQGGEKLIQHLSARYTLSKHLFKEIAHQRTVLIPTLSSEQKNVYYQMVLRTLLSIPLFDINEQVVRKLQRDYITVVPAHKKNEQKSTVASQIRSAKISSLASKMVLQKGREDKKLESVLLQEYRYAHSITSKKAMVYANLALFDYYAAIESEQQLVYIRQAATISKQITSFHTLDKQQILIKLATALYQVFNNFREACTEYESLFTLYPETKNNIYPAAKYIQVCLILSRFTQAQTMLDFTFHKLLHHDKHTVAANAALNYAKYYTLTHQFNNALAMIQKGMNLLKRKLYVQYEIEFRNLQTAVLVQQGDTETALAVIERNQKYLRSKGFKSSNSDFHEYYIILRDYITNPNRVIHSAMHRALLEKWSQGIYNVYGAILKDIVYGSTQS